MIEFLGAMTSLDFLLILMWIGITAFGARAGVVKAGFLAISIAVGAIAGAALARPLSHLTGPWAGVSAERGLPVTYFGLALLIMAVLFIILMLTYRRTNVSRNPTAEAILGGIGGFLVGFVAVEQLTGMLLVVTNEQWAFLEGARTKMRTELQTTPFLPLLAENFPFVGSLIESQLPISVEEACPRCL